jgi:hypothetical protein
VSAGSLASPAVVNSPMTLNIPRALFVPNHSIHMPECTLSIPNMMPTLASDFYGIADMAQMPQIDDGAGTPLIAGMWEMTVNAFLFHMPDQGFNILGVPDWHVAGAGRTLPGPQYDGYREVSEIQAKTSVLDKYGSQMREETLRDYQVELAQEYGKLGK